MVEALPSNSLFAPPAASSGTSASNGTLADNFDTFLQLLTTQLRNQNPLEPLGVNEFTQQLVQFAEVEQGLKQSEQNEKLISLQNSLLAANVIGLIDQTVYLNGAENTHTESGATWQINAAKDADDSSVIVRNAQGVEVFSADISLTEGRNPFEWDGRDSDGEIAPAGKYSIVVNAQTDDQIFVSTTTLVAGKVTSVDITGTAPQLKVGGNLVPLSDVAGVGEL